MKILDSVFDILFPPKCVFCGKLTDKETDNAPLLCADCEKSLPFTTHSGGITKGDFFSSCVSPLYYRNTVRASIHRFKFDRQESYARLYGKLIADCLAQHPEIKWDLITWVPISRKRFRKRGFNQAQTIAEYVAKNTGTTLWKTLRKIRHTPAQSTLSDKSQRRANIAGAYAMEKSVDVSGLSILLIDDVVTTGSTLSECSKVLLLAGAERVYCATLAKAGSSKVKPKTGKSAK